MSDREQDYRELGNSGKEWERGSVGGTQRREGEKGDSQIRGERNGKYIAFWMEDKLGERQWAVVVLRSP